MRSTKAAVNQDLCLLLRAKALATPDSAGMLPETKSHAVDVQTGSRSRRGEGASESLRRGEELRLGLVSVGRQRVAQSGPQRSKPGLVVSPLVDAFAADELPHLLGTRRAHVARGFVELQTGRLEGQTAEVQDAAHAALEVMYHVFVMHGQDLPGQRHVPVPHDFKVAAVVAGDVIDVVAELLPAGEQLLEIAEATGHGFAPGVDDLCVRQHQMDEADVAEVVRHFVDKERALRLTVPPRFS